MGGGTVSFEFLVLLVAIALAFDFMNGFHDAANSIATVVSTRVLRPHWAVIWAAFFNFLAYFVFGVAVAATVGKGIIDPKVVDHVVVFGADRRDHLERHHVDLRHPVLVVACVDRRSRRCGGGE